MRYRTLGRNGSRVSPYGLGALMFATSIGNADRDDSIRMAGVSATSGAPGAR